MKNTSILGPVLLLFVAGCGGVQRAIIGPLVEAEMTPVTHAPVPSPPSFEASPIDGRSRRWIVRSEKSHIDIRSGDAFGTYASWITRYQAFIGRAATQRADEAWVTVWFDITSLEAESEGVAAALQYDFLEIDAFPTAQLDARVRRKRAGSDECRVEGTLELHGKKRRIAFDGELHVDAEGARLRATFDLDRRPFDIRRRDKWDFFVRDDFRVALDLRATPERVTAEEVE